MKQFFRCLLSILCLMLLASSPALAKLKLEQKPGEMIGKLKLGDIEIIAIQDSPMDMPLNLFKGPLSEEQRNSYAQNSPAAGDKSGTVLASDNVFVIKTPDQTILVDSGLGDLANPESFFTSRLKQAGLSPEDIDLVVLTHMHYDHIGGLLKDGKAVFPKAKILVSNLERGFWLNPELLNDEYYKANAELAQRVDTVYIDRFKGFDFDQELAPGVLSLSAVGHTPGHTAYLVSSGEDAILFAGDYLHASALQFPNPDENAAFDMDPAKAAETRKALLNRAAQEKLPIAGIHVPFPGIGYVKENDKNGFDYTALEIQN